MPSLKNKQKIKVGITIGDPAGIGPAITLKATSILKGLADFVVIGDKGVFKKFPVSSFQFLGSKFIDMNNVPHKNFSFGKVKAEYGRASVEYLDKALELLKNKAIDCLVTCPVSKEAINKAGFDFSGHTEYLAKATTAGNFAMMLLNQKLKIVLLTRHIPLRNVPPEITEERLDKTILITHNSLSKLFLIKNPRIVVCGLNPHASDNGFIGNEENGIIKPAIARLKKKLKYIYGPLSADTAILKTSKNDYDCAVTMYHDQALIPLKLSDAKTGTNLTLGLGFIRTSPLHGTAFDIAGKYNLADPSSMIAAIKLAVKCTQNLKRS